MLVQLEFRCQNAGESTVRAADKEEQSIESGSRRLAISRDLRIWICEYPIVKHETCGTVSNISVSTNAKPMVVQKYRKNQSLADV